MSFGMILLESTKASARRRLLVHGYEVARGTFIFPKLSRITREKLWVELTALGVKATLVWEDRTSNQAFKSLQLGECKYKLIDLEGIALFSRSAQKPQKTALKTPEAQEKVLSSLRQQG